MVVRQHYARESMSYWGYLVDKAIFKKVTGNSDPNAYWRFEGFLWIVIGFCVAALGMVSGIAYIGYRLWTEIALEISYQQKYGANWQAEFERYHGSLAQAHSRLFIAIFGLLAVLAVLLWFGWQFHKRHKRRRHDHAA